MLATAPTTLLLGLLGLEGRAAAALTLARRSNPLLDVYRRRTFQYAQEAREAAASARNYADLAARAVAESNPKTRASVRPALERMNVDDWAYAALHIDRALHAPEPAKAAAASAEAQAPYEEAYKEYEAAKAGYHAAAEGYARRANQDAGLAKQLDAYANQYQLQGGGPFAAAYRTQARRLMDQAVKFKDRAEQYSHTEQKIYGALPTISMWKERAGAYAAYQENPTGMLRTQDVYAYTIAPPLAPSSQVDFSVSPSAWGR